MLTIIDVLTSFCLNFPLQHGQNRILGLTFYKKLVGLISDSDVNM